MPGPMICSTNEILEQLCKIYNFTFLDNSNITNEDLLHDQTHLDNIGLEAIEDNFLWYLNGNHMDPAHSDTSV